MEELILKWAEDRGILQHGTVSGQTKKLNEEVKELIDAQDAHDVHEIADAIGDIQVVLIILAELHGLSASDCLRDAYNVINARKGAMVNGVFVKESVI